MKSLILALIFFSHFASANELKTRTIKLGGKKLVVELAETESQQERGLMFRKRLEEGHGMLFLFKDEQPRRFWMKNTFIDLSIGYFDRNGILIDTQEMKAVSSEMEQSPPLYPSSGPAKYALEVPKGWFKKHKIKIGDKLVLE